RDEARVCVGPLSWQWGKSLRNAGRSKPSHRVPGVCAVWKPKRPPNLTHERTPGRTPFFRAALFCIALPRPGELRGVTRFTSQCVAARKGGSFGACAFLGSAIEIG